MGGGGGGGGREGPTAPTPLGALLPPRRGGDDPISHLAERFKGLDHGFKMWLSKQPTLLEAAVVAVTGAAQGALMGGLMGTVAGDLSSAVPAGAAPESLKRAQALAGGPLLQARNFAVMMGVNSGISCIMKRIRGAEDVQSSMVAAFGSGFMFSVVSGGGGPNAAANAVGSGVFFALIQGGFFQIGKMFQQQPGDDTSYARINNMLKGLGLENYMDNFKKGKLTDQTLSCLTESVLREVHVPPGPRLLILDHIQRDPQLMKEMS